MQLVVNTLVQIHSYKFMSNYKMKVKKNSDDIFCMNLKSQSSTQLQ